ncbi:MAG: Fic family protein [Candidatus Aenigmarchaeota archaeon]|nr:Fic family protein [Candidatus Aenigmarchaeota archaeon]
MTTEYDVFAELMRNKARISDLAKSLNENYANVYYKIKSLKKKGFILEKNGYYYVNLANKKPYLLAKIIDHCTTQKLNYNFFLNKNMSKILEISLNKDTLSMKDFKKFNHVTLKKYLDRLVQHNFIIVKSRKPLVFSLLRNQLLVDVIHFFGGEIKEREFSLEEGIFKEIKKELKKYQSKSKRQSKFYIKNIEEELKFDFIHSTTYLEGNTLSLEETIKLLKHGIYPKKDFDDILEVKNMDLATDYLFEKLKKPMYLEWILDLHRIIMQGLHEYNGKLRDGPVRILGNPNFEICDHRILMPRLEEFISTFNKKFKNCETIKDMVIFSGWAHNEFQHIHPFFDGNSRTTRILMNYCLLKFKFPLINVYDASKDEYLSLTKLAKKRDDEKFVAFLSRIILDNLIKLNEIV